MELRLIENGGAIPVLVETAAWEGVRRIADTLAEDIRLVTGKRPETGDEGLADLKGNLIFCATVGHSPLLEEMEKRGCFSAAEVRGKREVYKTALVENPSETWKRPLSSAAATSGERFTACFPFPSTWG